MSFFSRPPMETDDTGAPRNRLIPNPITHLLEPIDLLGLFFACFIETQLTKGDLNQWRFVQ
jgi:hypothetical protein